MSKPSGKKPPLPSLAPPPHLTADSMTSLAAEFMSAEARTAGDSVSTRGSATRKKRPASKAAIDSESKPLMTPTVKESFHDELQDQMEAGDGLALFESQFGGQAGGGAVAEEDTDYESMIGLAALEQQVDRFASTGAGAGAGARGGFTLQRPSASGMRERADTINMGAPSPTLMHKLGAPAVYIPTGLHPDHPDHPHHHDHPNHPDPSRRKSIDGSGAGAGAAEDDDNKKNDVKMRVGYFQMTGKQNVRYCFIPKSLLRKPDFDFDEAFAALQMKVPDLVFDLNSAPDVDEWNLRLPDEYKHLQTREMYDPEDKGKGITRMLLHYQGVVRENCKRLLRATAAACSQAGAVFRTKATWDMKRDCVAEWASESGDVDILLVAGNKSFYRDFFKEMNQPGKSKLFNPQSPETYEETEELIQNRIRIKTQPWIDGKRSPSLDANTGVMSDGLPHPCGSHVLISEDPQLLEKKLEKRIPTGYIIINGKTSATLRFCNAIQEGKPIFIFKHTGDSADLMCEALQRAREFAKARRHNIKARPKRPFEINMPNQFLAERYLWRFDEKMVASCQSLNILLDNFPHTFNPLSVLDIDMFTMTEEKLQDQLTKTMSVAFEGMVEMGGQALESKRLTYAWRMFHLFEHNAVRLKYFSDALEISVITMSMASTIASVAYTFLQTTNIVVIDTNRAAGIAQISSNYGLIALNLFLPLAISVLRAMGAAMTPGSKYMALKIAYTKIQSEIYHYRTKTGRYNTRRVQKKKPAAGDNTTAPGANDQRPKEDEQSKPSKLLGAAMDQIWADLLASDITKGALLTPQMFSDPLDSINDIISKNIRIQRLMTENLKPPAKNLLLEGASAITGGIGSVGSFFLGEKRAELLKFKINAEKDKFRKKAMEEAKHLKSKIHAEETEGNGEGLTPGGDLEMGDGGHKGGGHGSGAGSRVDGHGPDSGGSVSGMEDHSETEVVHADEAVEKKVVTASTAFKAAYDNGIDALSADEYIKIRLIPYLALFMSETPSLSKASQVVKSIVILLSVFSSILSTIDLIVLIPAVMALSGAATSWVSYLQTDLNILAKNSSINSMNKLIVWWDSLSLIEKRGGTNKEMLVMMTESAIQGQVLGFSNSDSQNSSDDKKDDDEKKE